MKTYADYKRILTGQPLPCALIDLDAFEKNLACVLEKSGSFPVRVATKSIRSVALLERIRAYHPRFQGLMCFHPLEACQLAERGFDNLLVAYPTVQSHSIRAVCEQVKQGKTLYLMVDCEEHVQLISDVARQEQVTLPLCMDIDMSMPLPGVRFGVYRSPVHSVQQALALHQAIINHPGVRLAGVMGYEAQIAGAIDHYPGRVVENLAIPLLKQRSVPRVHRLRQAVVAALIGAGADLDFVNGGGTGSVASTIEDPCLTEITVGSALFSPHLFDHYRDFRYQPAALFALEVVRKPDAHHLTCAGGGYMASGAPGPDKQPLPWLPQGLKLEPNEGAGEVQTPLRCENGKGRTPDCPDLGDPVFFRHAKAGELCEHFNTLLLVEHGSLKAKVPTYRGEGWHFL